MKNIVTIVTLFILSYLLIKHSQRYSFEDGNLGFYFFILSMFVLAFAIERTITLYFNS